MGNGFLLLEKNEISTHFLSLELQKSNIRVDLVEEDKKAISALRQIMT